METVVVVRVGALEIRTYVIDGEIRVETEECEEVDGKAFVYVTQNNDELGWETVE